MNISEKDLEFFQRAVTLANEAEKNQNLPIGAVIAYQGENVAEGKNAIWSPEPNYWHHAEMDALKSLPLKLRQKTQKMTLYTTLEPCLMCTGAILLYGIGRVLFGSEDPFGGSSSIMESLPPFFHTQMSHTSWIGPAHPEVCDALYERARRLENR